MSGTSPSPRPARQRKMTVKAQEMLDLDEYVNSGSSVLESEAEQESIQDSESEVEVDKRVDNEPEKRLSIARKPLYVDTSEEENEDSEDHAPIISSQEKSPKKDSMNMSQSARGAYKDLAEVVIPNTSPKKEKKSPFGTPLASPLKKMALDTPKTPDSPLKRKRFVQRKSTPGSSDFEDDHSDEEVVSHSKMSLDMKANGKSSASPRKLQRGSPSPSPRKSVKASSAVKAALTLKKEECLDSPLKVVAKRSMSNIPIKTERNEDVDVKGNASRKPPCAWSENEIEHIGQIYMQAISAVQGGAFKPGLERIWAEDESLQKTTMDINNHLRKWKKLFQTAISSMNEA